MSQSYSSCLIHIKILQHYFWGESCKNGEDDSTHRAKAKPELEVFDEAENLEELVAMGAFHTTYLCP